jgi:hypothetical protein
MDTTQYQTSNNEFTAINEKKGISGSTLKLIAIIVMLIDHIAAVVLEKVLIALGINNLNQNNMQSMQDFLSQYGYLLYLEYGMRLIGRLGFPIFCFLLVEGVKYTRNVWKYAMRLALFALISEIPFDLALHSKVFYFNYQNVFFTLLIGVLVMIGFQIIHNKAYDKKWLPVIAAAGAIATGSAFAYFINNIYSFIFRFLYGAYPYSLNIWLMMIIFSLIALIVYGIMSKKISLQKASTLFADLAILAVGMAVAEVLKTDYSAFGVLTIAVMYSLRKNSFKSMLGGCITLTIMSISEFTSFFTLIPLHFYNGKRGLKLKYVFYAFYPVHLFLLFLICYFLKLI